VGRALPADSDAGRHGTPVGAFAAGDGSANSTLSTVGVSWNSPVLQIKATATAQTGYVFDGVVAAETALNRGCRWINLSFGPGDQENPPSEEAFYIPEREFRAGYTNLLELAAERDAVLVFASGNDGAGANGFRPKNDNRFLPTNSSESDRPWRTHAMVIGATDVNKNVASFSVVTELRGSTHAASKTGTAESRAKGGVAQLRPGSYEATRRHNYAGREAWALNGGGNVPVYRDSNRDGHISEAERSRAERNNTQGNGILFHLDRGTSIGCQTLPPELLTKFNQALGGRSFRYTLIDANQPLGQ
jgi:subtilisin family serine protease